MKVLQLGKHYPFFYGGIERFYFELAQELNKRNITCDIFCANETNQSKIFYETNVKVISYGRFAFKASTSLSYKIFFELKKIINDYDILHVHFPDPMIVMALFVLKPKQAIVLHWHSDIVKQKYLKKIFSPFQNWILNRADQIIATSPNYIESSKDLKNYREKCIAIPSGLNPNRLVVKEEILSDLREKYKNKKIIYSFGRMTEYKGFEYLIESAKYLSNDYIILIAGGGNYTKYKNIIEENSLQNKVKILGRIKEEEVGSYYKLCDVFVLSSITRNEAFGLVQCEAMYFGKPIISTDIKGSGVSFVNQHNVTGLIVPIKDSKAIAKACEKIIGDKNLYNRFSKNARRRFEEMFHINSITNKITNIYKELLNDNKNKSTT